MEGEEEKKQMRWRPVSLARVIGSALSATKLVKSEKANPSPSQSRSEEVCIRSRLYQDSVVKIQGVLFSQQPLPTRAL